MHFFIISQLSFRAENNPDQAYQLAFSNHSKLHHVFHVSFLKKVIGTKFQTQTNLPELDKEGSIWLQPQAVLDQREGRLHQRTIKEVLVQWKYTNPTYATWEPNYHSAVISTSQGLRTRLFLRGRTC